MKKGDEQEKIITNRTKEQIFSENDSNSTIVFTVYQAEIRIFLSSSFQLLKNEGNETIRKK
jgi:hypothetical protein